MNILVSWKPNLGENDGGNECQQIMHSSNVHPIRSLTMLGVTKTWLSATWSRGLSLALLEYLRYQEYPC